MKQVKIFLYLAVCLLTAACSKSANGDATSLLQTVPADASSVAVINIEHTIEAMGGKCSQGKVTLPAEMQKALQESASMNSKRNAELARILNGESGVSLTSMVYYSAARSYISGLLDDPDKFISFIEEQDSVKATSADGARIVKDYVVIGNQFWICVEGTPDIEQLKYSRQLKERQSFASSEAASLLLEKDKAITFVADFNRTLSKMPQSMPMRMGSAFIFDDMTYIAGWVNLTKDKLTAEAAVLNSDMKPAAINLPIEKIDGSDVKRLKGNADVFFAIGISRKLVDKLKAAAGELPGAKLILSGLSEIDGTIAGRFNSSASDMEFQFKTTGENFTSISMLAEQMLGMTATRDGDIVTLTRGSSGFSGGVTPDEAASYLKGAWIGAISSGSPYRNATTALRLVPHKGSLMLEMEAKGDMTGLLKDLF